MESGLHNASSLYACFFLLIFMLHVSMEIHHRVHLTCVIALLLCDQTPESLTVLAKKTKDQLKGKW